MIRKLRNLKNVIRFLFNNEQKLLVKDYASDPLLCVITVTKNHIFTTDDFSSLTVDRIEKVIEELQDRILILKMEGENEN